jgi:hypothetical protein
MFNWKGRILFFVFLATLCFGLNTAGIVIGAFTIVNMVFNVYVVYRHPTLRTHMSSDERERCSSRRCHSTRLLRVNAPFARNPCPLTTPVSVAENRERTAVVTVASKVGGVTVRHKHGTPLPLVVRAAVTDWHLRSPRRPRSP